MSLYKRLMEAHEFIQASHGGSSNEFLQSKFLSRNKKIIC